MSSQGLEKPAASSAEVTIRMKATPQRDTPAEIRLRQELHRRGFRYRINIGIPGVIRGRPDMVFTKQKVAVFVDGCFWHSCPEHGTRPSANAEWWNAKLEGNVERDRSHDRQLEHAGWTVLRFWEHETASVAADAIEQALKEGLR